MRIIEEANLFLINNNSNKVYNIFIIDVPSYYNMPSYQTYVTFGRSGKKLLKGIKIDHVSLSAAQNVFDELLLSKTKKGYTVEKISDRCVCDTPGKPVYRAR